MEVAQVSRFLAQGQFLLSRIDNSMNTLQALRQMIASVQKQDPESSSGRKNLVSQLETVSSDESQNCNLRDLLSISIKSQVQTWCLDFARIQRTLVHDLDTMRKQLVDVEKREKNFNAKLKAMCHQEKYLCLAWQRAFELKFPTKLRTGTKLVGRQVIATFYVDGPCFPGMGYFRRSKCRSPSCFCHTSVVTPTSRILILAPI